MDEECRWIKALRGVALDLSFSPTLGSLFGTPGVSLSVGELEHLFHTYFRVLQCFSSFSVFVLSLLYLYEA